MRRWGRYRPGRPAAPIEQRLIQGILEGTYPPGSALPGERQLARELGVARPALRETLQRLARDGWVEIHHGRATRVNNYWRDGNLNVLAGIVRYGRSLPPNFATHLLEVRAALAPAYTRQAVSRAPSEVTAHLQPLQDLENTAAAFATADWSLHRCLTLASGNPIYGLLLNGFAGFYERVARIYFGPEATRRSARRFYADLLTIARNHDPDAAEEITLQSMVRSIQLWQSAASAGASGGPGT
jgi:GntR family negative regulator for fad regulon and positive regulator of fabA